MRKGGTNAYRVDQWTKISVRVEPDGANGIGGKGNNLKGKDRVPPSAVQIFMRRRTRVTGR